MSRLTTIILASDVVMVARGDLGVEIGDPELIGVQKKLIRRARSLNRIVITATQMMESMITSPMPNPCRSHGCGKRGVRWHRCGHAIGRNPRRVNTRLKPLNQWRKSAWVQRKMSEASLSTYRLERSFDTAEETIAMATMYSANHMKGIKAMISLTESGRTALMMSRLSSGLPIFAYQEMNQH